MLWNTYREKNSELPILFHTFSLGTKGVNKELDVGSNLSAQSEDLIVNGSRLAWGKVSLCEEPANVRYDSREKSKRKTGRERERVTEEKKRHKEKKNE